MSEKGIINVWSVILHTVQSKQYINHDLVKVTFSNGCITEYTKSSVSNQYFKNITLIKMQ